MAISDSDWRPTRARGAGPPGHFRRSGSQWTGVRQTPADADTLPRIDIRWAASVGEASRMAHERAVPLLHAEHLDERTWRYRVERDRTDALRQLLISEDVECERRRLRNLSPTPDTRSGRPSSSGGPGAACALGRRYVTRRRRRAAVVLQRLAAPDRRVFPVAWTAVPESSADDTDALCARIGVRGWLAARSADDQNAGRVWHSSHSLAWTSPRSPRLCMAGPQRLARLPSHFSSSCTSVPGLVAPVSDVPTVTGRGPQPGG